MAGSMNRHTPDPPDDSWWRRLHTSAIRAWGFLVALLPLAIFWCRRLLPRTLRERILVLALVPLAPLVLLVLGSVMFHLFTVGNTVLNENQQTAHVLATAFDDYVQDIQRQEMLISTAIATRGQPNWGWTNRLLATSVSQNPTVRTMAWISPQGRILASSVPIAVGTDIRGNAPLPQLLAGGTWVVSDLLPSGPISRTMSVVMATAERVNTGQLRGILLAEIDPDKLGDVLLRYRRPDGNVAAIFDHQGYPVVSTPPRQGTWDERAEWRQSDPLLRRTLSTGNENRGVVTPATFEASQYAVYTPIAGTGYIVGVLLPTAAARAPIERSVLWNLLLLWLVAGLVGLVAYFINSTIIDPIRTLRADIARFGRKEVVIPLTEVAPTEIHELHSAVTAMATMLIQRIDSSEAERDRLHTIIEMMPVGVRFVNATGEVLLANPLAREMLGVDALGMSSTPRGRYTLHRLDGAPLPLAEIPLVRALHEGQPSRNKELVIRYENGEGILTLISATPVPDAQGVVSGVIEVVVEVVSDVVKLQEISVGTNLEQQLASMRTQLKTLLEILPVGVLILDAQGQIISANAESTRLWGGMLPALTSLSDFRFFHGWWTRSGEPLRPDEWPPVRALTKNETVINDAITLNRFDGLRGNVLTSAAPLHNAQGALSGAVWVLQDQ